MIAARSVHMHRGPLCLAIPMPALLLERLKDFFLNMTVIVFSADDESNALVLSKWIVTLEDERSSSVSTMRGRRCPEVGFWEVSHKRLLGGKSSVTACYFTEAINFSYVRQTRSHPVSGISSGVSLFWNSVHVRAVWCASFRRSLLILLDRASCCSVHSGSSD
jgi:hypothetical protein